MLFFMKSFKKQILITVKIMKILKQKYKIRSAATDQINVR